MQTIKVHNLGDILLDTYSVTTKTTCLCFQHPSNANNQSQGVALARPKLAEFSFIAVSLRARGAAIELIVVF